jgi:hypothetical protein
MQEISALEPEAMPCGCAIMDAMSDETRARLTRANRNYVRLKKQFEDARAELADAIIAERKDGGLIEDITALVAYRQTQVNRILEAAGLTEKRGPRREP